MRSTAKIISFICCLLYFFQPLSAQNQSLDPRFIKYDEQLSKNPRQVLNELLATPISESKPELVAQYYYMIGHAYLSLTYPQKSLAATNQALSQLTDKQPEWLYYRILITQSQAMELNGQAREALPLAKQALNWADSQNTILNNQSMVIDALIALGYIENTLGNSVAALNAFMRAYNMAPLTDAINTKSAIASSLALVYEFRREDKLAIPYFEEAVAYHRHTDNNLELSIALYGLGRANKNIGEIETGKNQLQESLKISRTIDDAQGVAYALKELAPLYMQTEQFDQAESMLHEAAELFGMSQNKFMLFDIHKTLSQLYLAKNDSNNAQLNIKMAKEYLNPKRMPIQAISIEELESQVNASQGLYQEAFVQLIKTVNKKQKLLSEQSTQQLHELRSQFELEAQAKENSLLAQENAEQKLQLINEEQQNQRLIWAVIATATLIVLLIGTQIHNRKQQNKLYRLANYDQLTGLPNRSYVLQKLQASHQKLKPNHSIFIVMLDLDHFKQINDRLGHDVGDQVLNQIGQLCRQHIVQPHIAGRFGGEEFLLAFFDSSVEEVTTIIETLRQHASNINNRIKTDNNTACPPISFSAGLSSCQSNKAISDCIKNADLAMYQAKNAGRNQMVAPEI